MAEMLRKQAKKIGAWVSSRRGWTTPPEPPGPNAEMIQMRAEYVAVKDARLRAQLAEEREQIAQQPASTRHFFAGKMEVD